MAQFHFVEDYENLIHRLVAAHPIDEAMALAVGGGDFAIFGLMEAEIVKAGGLANGMRIVDLGCGSGRLASALHMGWSVHYVGIDIIQALLDYAKTKAPGYQFILHRGMSIPQPDRSADMVSAFSLFTHLLQAEIYVYLQECVRILKPGGRVVFSFLEFSDPSHWKIFEDTASNARNSVGDHLNMFLERDTISFWAGKLGLTVEKFYDSNAKWGGHEIGQSVVVLRKPLEGAQ